MSVRSTAAGIAVAALLFVLPRSPHGDNALHAAQTAGIDLDFSRVLAWRPVGPPMAGRVTAIDGVASLTGTFYAGTAGGGLWRTTDFGASWTPVFDAPPTGAVSAVAVAPSRPDVIYVAAASGTDDAAQSGVLYKTTDGGSTWRSIGLRTRGRIAQIALSDDAADVVFASVNGAAGGVFRSVDGGGTFDRVLDVPGAEVSITVHVQRSDVVFAASSGPNGSTAACFRSTDRGRTWQPIALADAALEPGGAAALSLAAAPATGDLFLLVARDDGATLWRSDDLGGSWERIGALADATLHTPPQMRIAGSGTIHVLASRLWISRDGGATFDRAADVPPGRHDRLIWLHRTDDNVMLLAGDAGAILTVNGGATWSADASPAAAELDRVAVDSSFPYRICAATPAHIMCAPNRTDRGDPASGDWQAMPAALSGTAVPDPLDPDVVFGGDIVRYDRRIGQAFDAGTPDADAGPSHPAAFAFSNDGRTLYAASRGVWRTTNGGLAWTAAGTDLTAGNAARVSALAVSPVDARVIWAGLDDGRVHVTRDAGATWTEARPPSGQFGCAIRSIEPSRFDPRSVYAVVACVPAGAIPQLMRTRDAGETWVNIAADLSDSGRVHVVREDPFRRGLLFAGADRGAFVSFDDGERWQPLQLNLPATAVRDLVIKDADLVAATAGRGVWVLDDMSPLRQLTADIARTDVFLLRPAQAWRTRATDAGPDASEAWLTYLLGDNVPDEIAIDIIESATGDVLRRFSSRPDADLRQTALPVGPGLHRVGWDLRYSNPAPGRSDAVPGTRVMPGVYQVRLTTGGRVMRQALSIRMDPRVRTPTADLAAQRDLGRAVDAARAAVHVAMGDRSGGDSASLAGARADLDRIAGLLQQADARPSPRLERLATEAIERATAAIDDDSRSVRRVFGLAFD